MADWLKLIPAAEARRILLSVVPVGRQAVPLREAAGRVLAEALVAPHDLPPSRLSAMDGYAIRSDDVQAAGAVGAGVLLRVIASVPAGTTFAGVLGKGQAVGVATGSVVPEGADAVMMVELTEPVTVDGAAPSSRGGGRAYALAGTDVRVSKAVPAGANIVMPGEDLRAGVEILPAGRRLRAGDVAALATFGIVDVPVYRRPVG